jgi:hypothetical protein
MNVDDEEGEGDGNDAIADAIDACDIRPWRGPNVLKQAHDPLSLLMSQVLSFTHFCC